MGPSKPALGPTSRPSNVLVAGYYASRVSRQPIALKLATWRPVTRATPLRKRRLLPTGFRVAGGERNCTNTIIRLTTCVEWF